jgi:hypothetical protein
MALTLNIWMRPDVVHTQVKILVYFCPTKANGFVSGSGFFTGFGDVRDRKGDRI